MLEELGVPYEWVRVEFSELRKPEYLKINPNARMPFLVDGDVELWESMAINLYLAEKYDRGLWPSDPAKRAHVYKWTFWAATEAEPHVFECLRHRWLLPPERRVAERADVAERALQPLFAVLDEVLGRTSCLIGEDLTAADINVASIVSSVLLAGVDLSAYPSFDDWLRACVGRDYPAQFFPVRTDV